MASRHPTDVPFVRKFWMVVVLFRRYKPTKNPILATVARWPPTSSSLRITDRSFRYASPCLWNQLPISLRQLHFSPSVSVLPVHAPTTSHSVNSPLSQSITPSLFHSRLKTYLFHKSFPSVSVLHNRPMLKLFFWVLHIFQSLTESH